MRYRRGFSLLEFVFAMLIVLLLAVLAIDAYSDGLAAAQAASGVVGDRNADVCQILEEVGR